MRICQKKELIPDHTGGTQQEVEILDRHIQEMVGSKEHIEVYLSSKPVRRAIRIDRDRADRKSPKISISKLRCLAALAPNWTLIRNRIRWRRRVIACDSDSDLAHAHG